MCLVLLGMSFQCAHRLFLNARESKLLSAKMLLTPHHDFAVIGKHKELVDGTPLEVEVFPGALSSQHCGIVGNSLGSGTLLYGGFCRFGLYLRDPFGNYISCAHYFRGLTKHNISELSVYHEMVSAFLNCNSCVNQIRGLTKHDMSRLSVVTKCYLLS